jgi:Protein of unknown function (DUF998)
MKDKLWASGLAAGRRLLGVSLTQAFSGNGFDLSRPLLSLLSLSDVHWLQIGNSIDTGALILACALGVRQALGRDLGSPWRSTFVAGFSAGPASGQPGSLVNAQRFFRSSNGRD